MSNNNIKEVCKTKNIYEDETEKKHNRKIN